MIMSSDNEKFFILEKPSRNSTVVRYLITTRLDFKTASIKLCKEQSLSNALGNDMDVVKKFVAKYIPSSIKRINKYRFQVDVIFPFENCENSLSMILSAAGGDTYNIKNLYPIKILSITLPPSFIRNYDGPNYGIEGLRKRLNIYGRPILMGPVKPCVGMKPIAFAQRAKEALLGGTDIVKDDELICNPSYSQLAVRVQAVSQVVREAEEITREKKMYFAFIGSGSPFQIMKNAEVAKANGADGFMISPAINGLEIIKDLKNIFGIPIIAHNAFMYSAYTRDHGISFCVLVLFQRLCGADIVITPAKYRTFDVMSRQEHIENISALSKNISGIKKSFPAFCGGQSPETVSLLKRDVGNNNFIVVAGTSLYDHQDGPTAGAKSLRESFVRNNQN